jgi:hypothetical protein
MRNGVECTGRFGGAVDPLPVFGEIVEVFLVGLAAEVAFDVNFKIIVFDKFSLCHLHHPSYIYNNNATKGHYYTKIIQAASGARGITGRPEIESTSLI